ncbi:Fc.00g077170.m01.CDS01 [Cosmosporella sp. VM-42]
MSSNFNALFRPSTPPPNEYGRFRNTSQSGLTFEFWDDDDDAALPADSDALDNEFLDFLENEFSSPSTYPSFTYPSQNPPAAGSRSHQLPQTPAPGPGSAPFPSSTAPRNQNNPSVAAASGACILHASAPERSETQLTTSTTTTTVGESQNTLFGIDNIDDLEYDDLFDTPASSFDENMPPSLRRRPEVATPPVDSVHRSKRRRTSTNAATPNLRKAPSSRAYATKIKIDDDDCIFEDKHSRATPGLESKTEDLTTIDLTEANEVPEELKKPEVDNRIKISAFQCVICMDDCTTLSVTHCGHMYCAQCLHSSLNVEATKGKCPMCRQKLELKPRETYTTKTKGFWPLELKLMTATRKGKRKANSMA